MNYVIVETGTEKPLFWNNDYGWTELSEATIFDENEIDRLMLPMGINVSFVMVDKAINLRLEAKRNMPYL